jgi:hypothetical protein
VYVLFKNLEQIGISVQDLRPDRQPWNGRTKGLIVVGAARLTELQVAMLDMIEYGIETWSSSASYDMASELQMRGLITVTEHAADAERPHRLTCTITEAGSAALEEAKQRAPRPRQRRSRRLAS